ncbi:MAG TPA: oxidoreductase, partial [Planctomycetaceae bacterium]|nr:oxidoreductase [Planctomycetaceae bacterium]
MADCHLVAYRAAGLNPVAITSRSESKAREVAARHEIKTVHLDWHDLVADDQVEVLDVAVPPDVQLEVV